MEHNPTIIYTRCSTEKQNNTELHSTSLETQIYNCTNFGNSNNMPISDVVSEICSATKSSNQKKLLQLIDNITNFNLIIFDVSRFSRNIFDGTVLIKKCRDNNITIYSVKENICTNTNYGIKQFLSELMNAQNESDAISYRVSESIKYRKSLGAFIGGKVPYGHELYRDENNVAKLAINVEESDIIWLILKLKYGCIFNEIGMFIRNVLNSEDHKIILYGHFTDSDIAFILNNNNIFYRGKAWTGSNVHNISFNNMNYINEKETLTKDLIKRMYNGCSSSEISEIYYNINGYQLNDNLLDMKKYKKNKNEIIKFLNKHNVFFNLWTTVDDLVMV
jgi:DNA invertase Pin-like site-specific DNA recombinase